MTSPTRSAPDRVQLWAEASGMSVETLNHLLRTGVNLGVLPADLPILQVNTFQSPKALPVKKASGRTSKAARPRAKGDLLVGHAPNGRTHRYLPCDKLSTADFQEQVMELWDKAGYYEEDVRFTDHRGGPKGLESGGKHFAPGVLRLAPDAPGFHEVRTQSGSPAWVANAFFADSGKVVIKIGHEYEDFWNRTEG